MCGLQQKYYAAVSWGWETQSKMQDLLRRLEERAKGSIIGKKLSKTKGIERALAGSVIGFGIVAIDQWYNMNVRNLMLFYILCMIIAYRMERMK